MIGLGYVDLPLAVDFGKKRSVNAFDIHTLRVSELQFGQRVGWSSFAQSSKRLKYFLTAQESDTRQ